MLMYIGRRVAAGVAMLFVITAAAYSLLYIDSANIARRILGQNATPDLVAQKSEELGLDRSLLTGYMDWLSSAVTGDLGRSWFNGELVAVSVQTRLSVSMSIVIGATILAAIIAVALGVVAARRGGWVDAVVQVIAVIGFAVPGFLIALYLVLVFAINLGWFNATGYTAVEDGVGDWLRSVTLPIAALSLAAIAAVAQQVRGSVVDALDRDYVRTLRARGIRPGSVIYRHVLRNAAAPALAVLAVQFVGLLGGAVIVEQVFALPGLGALAVSATTQGDIPVVMGVVVAFAVVVLVVNLVIDLAQAALNPKVRLS